jgi:hypothetical protein
MMTPQIGPFVLNKPLPEKFLQKLKRMKTYA